MTEPTWLSQELVLAIHEEQLKEFGGASGTRDVGALESALQLRIERRQPDPALSGLGHEQPKLAAAYAFGLARNHPFVDGNKRTALVAIVTFLGLNGLDFVASEAEAVVMILGLAAGEVNEDGLTRWIRDNLAPG